MPVCVSIFWFRLSQGACIIKYYNAFLHNDLEFLGIKCCHYYYYALKNYTTQFRGICLPPKGSFPNTKLILWQNIVNKNKFICLF